MNQLSYTIWFYRIFFVFSVCVLLNVLVTVSNESKFMKVEIRKFSNLADQNKDSHSPLRNLIDMNTDRHIEISGRMLKAYYFQNNFYDYSHGGKNVSVGNQCLEWMQRYSISLLEHTDNLPEDMRVSWHEKNCGLMLIRRYGYYCLIPAPRYITEDMSQAAKIIYMLTRTTHVQCPVTMPSITQKVSKSSLSHHKYNH